ncbi:TonB-dependent receptor plug domain-containing protein [Desulfonatronum thiodismutans]|uniref:TonB-dependent receptor plug domain-containing protein n=1 Tax=Desulfonatronum thiodismutans TaxID=159290 RepID=UPI0004ABE1DE|nr:TonB-dependent receptor [Desulfonatronum thiodismutans]
MRLSWKFGTVLLSALCLAATSFAEEAPRQAAEVEEYVVTGTRTRHTLQDVPVETQVITREDIERMPSQNILDALKTVPGINVSTLDDVMGSDNIRSTMRGLQFNEGYGLILIDGQRVHGEMGAHGDYGISLNQIPLSMIERIEIVKGAASALYGSDALAGVINIITRKAPKETTVFGGAAYGRYEVTKRQDVSVNKSSRNYYRANAGFGGPALGNSGYFFQYSYEQDEGIAFDPATTNRHSLMGKWNTDITENLSINLGANYGRARRDLDNPVAEYDREYDSYRFSGGLNYTIGDHEVVLNGSTYWQDFINGYPGFDHGYRDGKIGYDQAELVYHWYTDWNILTVGGATQRQHMDYFSRNYLRGEEQSTVTVDRNVTTNSLFVQDELMLFDRRLTLVPGARLEDHSTFGTEINPKFSAMYRVFDATTLRGSVGRAFKSPTIRQLYYDGLVRHGEYYMRSNPDLNPETAWTYSLNLEQGLMNDRLTFNLGFFYSDLKDMVVRQATGEIAPDGIPIESYFNVEKAQIQGGELSARLTLSDAFFLNAGFSYTDSENKDTGLDLPYVPKYTFSLAPTYVFQPWDVGASVILTQVGKQYRNMANTQELGAHATIDARIWKQFSRLAKVSADFKNITNSDRGEGDYAHRMGRSIGINLEIEF